MERTPPPTWRLGYRPALDGLRAIAVLLVMLRHSGLGIAGSAGGVGVMLFFVLSGFLITSLLVEERQRTGSISLPRFYARRALRLVPALVTVVLVVTLVSGSLPHAAAALLYVGNWVRMAGGDLGPLGHTWTLGVEEQFYLLWPLALVLIGRRALPVAIGVAAISLIEWPVLVVAGASPDRIGFGLDLMAAPLMVGCALGLWMTSGRRLRLPTWVQPVAFAAVLALAVPSDRALLFGTGPLVTLTAGLLVASLLQPGPVARLLSWRPLVGTGRISYGIYLWHGPIFWAGVSVMPAIVGFPVLVAVTFAAALASYRWIERPFLQMKRRLEPAVARPVRQSPVMPAFRS